MVALKTDPVWAAISRFGQPWPPFDENSREWPWLKQQFGDQIQLVDGSIESRGEIIRENFQRGGKFTMRLGIPSGDLIKKCAARPETEDAARMLFQKERQLVVDEGWLNKQRKHGGDHRVHFTPMPDHQESKPLEIGDCDLIPSIWRKPDRVYNAGSGSVCLEIDSLQGNVFRMIVNLSKEAPRMQTFYRTSSPYTEKQ